MLPFSAILSLDNKNMTKRHITLNIVHTTQFSLGGDVTVACRKKSHPNNSKILQQIHRHSYCGDYDRHHNNNNVCYYHKHKTTSTQSHDLRSTNTQLVFFANATSA